MLPGPSHPTENDHWSRAMHAQAERRYDAAVVLWEVYSERYPNEIHAHSNRCLCLLNSGRFGEALQVAREVCDKDRNKANRTCLLESLALNELVDELETEASSYTEDFPDDFHGWSSLGLAAFKRGDYRAAEGHFRRAVDLNSAANFAWTHLGAIYFETGQYARSLDACGKAQASVFSRPGNLDLFRHEALIGMGWSLLMMEMPDRALILAQQAEPLNIDTAEIQRLKARCLLSMDHPDGLAAAENAFHLGCTDKYLKVRAAYEYALLENTERANELLEGVDPQPHDTNTRHMYAAAMAAAGRLKEAIAELEALDGKLEPYVRFNSLAGARKLKGDFEGAEEAALRALEIRRDEIILTNLGMLYNDLDRFAEAESLLEEALDLRTDFPDALFALGIAKYGLEKDGEAREYLNRALKSENLRSNRKTHAARLLERMESGAQLQANLKEQGIVHVLYKDIERLQQRSQRQDTLRYEDECARLVQDKKGSFRWKSVETQRRVRHANNEREADLCGIRQAADGEVICVGECKLKTSTTVAYGEVEDLVERMALVLCDDRHRSRRSVEGFFFSSASYDPDAIELACRHGIRMFRVVPEKHWWKRADWHVRVPIEEVLADT